MRVAELYAQTALLGFEPSLEYTDAFYYAANRALMQINALRPRIGEYEIFRYLPKNHVCAGFAPMVRESDICFEAQGVKSYCFFAKGKGTLFIEMKRGSAWSLIGERELDSKDFAVYRGFIKADGEFTDETVRLRFAAHTEAEYVYFVKCVAMYASLLGEGEADIPTYEEWTVYDMPTLADDFLAFDAPPKRADGSELESGEYGIDGGKRLLLPYSARGVFKILYRRRPTPLEDTGEPENDVTEIDLDEELCALLPNLIAAYVWADDEPDKAQYYLTLYRERAQEIERRDKNYAPIKIINKSGW